MWLSEVQDLLLRGCSSGLYDLETGPSAKPGPLGLGVGFLWAWRMFLSTQT